jgi:hypothetical protein
LRRFGIPEIALGALLAVAIFAVGASVQIINPKNYGGEAQSGKNAAPISAPKPSEETDADTNGRIADYNRDLDWLTLCLVVANIALWWVTWRSSKRQSGDMQAALDHAQGALATVERAFVFIDGFNVELTTALDSDIPNYEWIPSRYRKDPGLYITRFAAQPRWKNGGNTPTDRLAIQIDWRMFSDGIPPDFEFPYRDGPGPLFLAPQAVEPTSYLVIPPAQALVDWGNNPAGVEPAILIWGRADYRDVFDKAHFVEWCYWLRFSRPRRGDRMTASFIQWGQYNRTDHPA